MSKNMIHLFTMGFTKKSAEEFFAKLADAGVRRVVDIRLHNVYQLMGFTKGKDLPFFLRRVANIDYVYMPELAPTQAIRDAFTKEKGDWKTYETQFLALMAARGIEKKVEKSLLHRACLLCSEVTPEYCHRRLVAEYLGKKWGHVEITHIL